MVMVPAERARKPCLARAEGALDKLVAGDHEPQRYACPGSQAIAISAQILGPVLVLEDIVQRRWLDLTVGEARGFA